MSRECRNVASIVISCSKCYTETLQNVKQSKRSLLLRRLTRNKAVGWPTVCSWQNWRCHLATYQHVAKLTPDWFRREGKMCNFGKEHPQATRSHALLRRYQAYLTTTLAKSRTLFMPNSCTSLSILFCVVRNTCTVSFVLPFQVRKREHNYF